VAPGKVFSQNNSIGPYSASRGFRNGPAYIGAQVKSTTGGGVCKIASTLYNVTVLSNLQVVERHAHRMPVPYVPYGQDATVSFGVKDFKFRNNSDYPVLIWAAGIDNRLYLAFYGKTKPPAVQWHHRILKKVTAYTLYRTNSLLPAGSRKTVVQGMNGAVVDSWVTVSRAKGGSITKKMGKSWYDPLPNVIETGTKRRQ
jgi:vancomycin resistance protein YoaR